MFIELRKAMINTGQIQLFTKNKVFMSGVVDPIEISEEEYDRLFLALGPRERKTKTDSPRSDLEALFDELHQLTGGKKKAAFTQTREKKLNHLLTKERMTPEMLRVAATNIKNNSYLQGDNDKNERYGDIDYLLRPEKAAKWSNEQVQKKKGMFQ